MAGETRPGTHLWQMPPITGQPGRPCDSSFPLELPLLWDSPPPQTLLVWLPPTCNSAPTAPVALCSSPQMCPGCTLRHITASPSCPAQLTHPRRLGPCLGQASLSPLPMVPCLHLLQLLIAQGFSLPKINPFEVNISSWLLFGHPDLSPPPPRPDGGLRGHQKDPKREWGGQNHVRVVRSVAPRPAGCLGGQHPGAPASRAPQVLGASFQKGERQGAAARQEFLSSSENISGMRSGQGRKRIKEGAVRTKRGT